MGPTVLEESMPSSGAAAGAAVAIMERKSCGGWNLGLDEEGGDVEAVDIERLGSWDDSIMSIVWQGWKMYFLISDPEAKMYVFPPSPQYSEDRLIGLRIHGQISK